MVAGLTRRAVMRMAAQAVVAGGALTLVGCGAGKSGDAVVDMVEMRFEPASLTVRTGTTVTWKNESSFVHTVTTDSAKLVDGSKVSTPEGMPFDSGTIQPGASWSHTFETLGEFRYCCAPHELANMMGTITVTE